MWWNGGDSATSNYKFGSLGKSYEEKNETKFLFYFEINGSCTVNSFDLVLVTL